MKRIWRNDDLQSFTPLRFLPPQLMGYQGRAVVIDPDIFATGDIWELLSRDMAGKFNRAYGEVFPLPQAVLVEAGAKVPGTDGQKMSKSYGNNIDIFGDEKEMRKRVMSIVTDSVPVDAQKDPTTCRS